MTGSERLYQRLPLVLRQRDLAQGEPLRALLAVMEAEREAIEVDILGLYENSFIETCEPWVVPYIAELLGIRVLGAAPHASAPPRTQVANTLNYRRHKGTAVILERLARDIVGWHGRAVEDFAFLGHTQNPTYPRFGKGTLFDIRRPENPALAGGPFAPPEHFRTVDVRRIANHRGRYNLPNLALFLWRLKTFALHAGPARQAPGTPAGRYSFDALGRDTRLFNHPATRAEIVRLAAEHELPVALRLEAVVENPAAYYGPERALAVATDGTEVDLADVVFRDLSDWTVTTPATDEVAIDVRLGRLMFGAARLPADPTAVRVSYSYAFAADLGGGPYDRRDRLADPASAVLEIAVAKSGPTTTLQQALAQWDAAGKPHTIVRIEDSEVYGGLLGIDLMGSRLVIEAADGERPHLRLTGSLAVHGIDPEGRLALNGLRFEGGLVVTGSFQLMIEHCTLIPGGGDSLRVGAAGLEELAITIDSSLVGALRLPAEMPKLTLRDTLVDGVARAALAADDSGAPGPPTTLERVTLFGEVSVRELILATEVLFTAALRVEQRHVGCVRFSYLPPGSEAPPCFRCQPHLALAREAESLGLDGASGLAVADRDRVLAAVVPRFTTTRYGDPGYGQLAEGNHPGIATGAEDGSEPGVFHLLHKPQREHQLRQLIDEYSRFGLDVGFIFAT